MSEFEKLEADLLTFIQEDDPETAHINADKVLKKIALSEGLSLEQRIYLVDLWDQVKKWYS